VPTGFWGFPFSGGTGTVDEEGMTVMSSEVETMAYAGETPWHGQGTKVEGLVTPAEMAKAAGIDWMVTKQPMFFQGTDGEVYRANNKYALVRDSDQKMMTITGEAWAPIQNTDVLEFMGEYAKAGGAALETAGSLRGGEIIWGLMRLNREFEVRKGDRVKGYVLFTSPHIVGKASLLSTTSVRVVCMNTMMAAMNEGSVEYRQNHMKAFDFNAARLQLALANEAFGQHEANARLLAKTKLGLEDAVNKVLLPTFFPDIIEDNELAAVIMQPENQPKVLQQLIGAIVNGPGATPGDAWGVMNGITFWSDHIASTSAESRLARSWVGDLRTKKAMAQTLLLKLAE
jgi:phage/plasmid-like protein (TIGR03299 family)